MMAAEPRLHPPAGDWLLFLGQHSGTEVACRLEHAGYLDPSRQPLPGRSRRSVPGDRDWAHSPLLRTRAALHTARTPTPYAALLAGLTTRMRPRVPVGRASPTRRPAAPREAIRLLSPAAAGADHP